MKILIVYYSRSGMNEKLAKVLQENLGCEMEKIEEFEDRRGMLGFIKSGMQSVLKKRTEIKPTKYDPAYYDIVIVVSPIWAGFIPPPMRTYLYNFREKFRRLAYASVSYSGYGNSKVLSDLEHLILKKVESHLLLKENEVKSSLYHDKVGYFLENLKKLE
ncbi:MAG: flavodoxin family protein [Nitrososphaeria archaeon]|nr:flavodoxin family protein [Nitrososphaeria archaeon]